MITFEEIEKLSKLIKINIHEEQMLTLQSQLTSMMGMIDQLKEIDCNEVEPLVSVTDKALLMRQDIAEPGIIDEVFSNVSGPETELAHKLHYYIVPKVIE